MNESKRRDVEDMILEIYTAIGCDRPDNHNDILDFIVEDIDETADPEDWHSGDVAIAFRRWMESNAK